MASETNGVRSKKQGNFFQHMLSAHFLEPLASASWRFPLGRCVTSRSPVVVLYHGVPSAGENGCIDFAVFESHIRFLKRHFELITPQQLGERRRPLDRIKVLLTFDDGFRNQFEIAKRVLLRQNVPALFFICSRHAKPGSYLWFTHIRMLSDHFQGPGLTFRGIYFSMRPEDRESSMARLAEILLDLKPHPTAMYRAIEEELPCVNGMIDSNSIADHYQGLSAEQVAEIAREPQFTIGCHTVDHPCLSRCTSDEVYRQIRDNMDWLERVSNRKCRAIAYPSGDYDARILEQCRDLNLSYGFAVSPKFRSFPRLEIPRVGVYSPSLEFLGCKIQWGVFLRQVGLSAG